MQEEKILVGSGGLFLVQTIGNQPIRYRHSAHSGHFGARIGVGPVVRPDHSGHIGQTPGRRSSAALFLG